MVMQQVDPAVVPLSVLREVDLEYSVEVDKNKFICCEETATKVLNERLFSSDK